jgi:hypothetical protein
MAEEEKMERKPSRSRIRGMSLYAGSADYERRLSEDIPQTPETDADDETQGGDEYSAPRRSPGQPAAGS